MKNNFDKFFFNIINEIAKYLKLEVKIESSHFRLLSLKYKEEKKLIYGTDFGLNNTDALRLFDNKCCLLEFLKSNNIPIVNFNFIDMQNRKYFYQNDNEFLDDNKQKLYDFLKTNMKIVLKDNKGADGKNVFLIESINDIDTKLNYFINHNISILVQPFVEIDYEIRSIILDKKIKLMYKKTISNHKKTWKHNLSDNINVSLEFSSEDIKEITNLIKAIVNVIPGVFYSIDLVKLKNGDLLLLEINNNVTLIKFAKFKPEYQIIMKDIYQQAIEKLFKIN